MSNHEHGILNRRGGDDRQQPAPHLRPTGSLFTQGVITTLAVGALVCAVVAGVLWQRNREIDIINAPELAVLRSALKLDPSQSSVRRQIRDMDQQMRQAYFVSRATARRWTGAAIWLGVLALALGRLQPEGVVAYPARPATRAAAVVGRRRGALLLAVSLPALFFLVWWLLQ